MRTTVVRTALLGRRALCSSAVAPTPSSPTAPTGNWLVRAENRALLHVEGVDALPFLQNLVTADIKRLAPPSDFSGIQYRSATTIHEERQRPGYAAFLSREGRMLADCIVVPTQTLHSTPDLTTNLTSYLLDVHAHARPFLMKHMAMYKLRSKVAVTDVTDQHSIMIAGGPDMRELVGTFSMKSFGTDGMKLLVDPRTPELGVRIISPVDEPLRLPFFFREQPSESFTVLRYSLGVPEGPEELPPSKLFPLECNVLEMNGVSFDKGCYLGQELVARVHHTGQIRKRVLPIQVDAGTPEVGCDVLGSDAKAVGKVLGVCGNMAIAMLRLNHVIDDLTGKRVLVGDATGTVLLPQHLRDAVGRDLERG